MDPAAQASIYLRRCIRKYHAFREEQDPPYESVPGKTLRDILSTSRPDDKHYCTVTSCKICPLLILEGAVDCASCDHVSRSRSLHHQLVLGTIDYCALPTSRRRVGNASLEPRPVAEAII